MAEKSNPLSTSEIKAIHATHFSAPLVEDRARDKKVIKVLREDKPHEEDKD